jgi:hypothetical protein
MSYKKADPKNRPAAKKVATACNVNIVYVNSKGEHFTSENAAQNSDKLDNIEVHDFTKPGTVDDAAKDDGGKKAVKLSAAMLTKYPELATNGWKAGDEVEDLDWAINNKKPEEPKA